jgi:hypothetical protein
MTETVMSFGGGTQSWGLAALVKRGELPSPDYAVMIDTGRECASTWAYLAAHRAALPFPLYVVSNGIPALFWRNGQRDCLLPAYTDTGKLPPFCSGEWKRDAFRRYLRQERGVKRASVWFGISYDEAERMTNARPQWLTNAYPLVDNHIRRGDCIQAAASVFGELPPRSRCWMCPNQHREDWLNLPADEIDKAAEVDELIRVRGLYLSRHRLPIRESVTLDDSQLRLFGEDCDGYCFV